MFWGGVWTCKAVAKPTKTFGIDYMQKTGRGGCGEREGRQYHLGGRRGPYSTCAYMLCSLCTHGQLGRLTGGAGRCSMMCKATGVRAEALTAAVDDKGPPRQPHKQAPTTQTFRANFGANLEGAVAGPPWPSTHLMKPHPAARGLAGYRGAMALRLRAGRRQRAAAIPPPRERYLNNFYFSLLPVSLSRDRKAGWCPRAAPPPQLARPQEPATNNRAATLTITKWKII